MTNDYGNLELHTVLLSAMKDIHKICQENNLKYYLHAGTLLGAVNHKGFIPWDDDVDITLIRSDFEKIAKIIERDYSDRYYIQTYKNDIIIRITGLNFVLKELGLLRGNRGIRRIMRFLLILLLCIFRLKVK